MRLLRVTQPQKLLGINLENGITRGLMYLFDGINEVNLVSGNRFIKTGSFTPVSDIFKGVSNNGNASVYYDIGINPSSELSFINFGFTTSNSTWIDDDNGTTSRVFQFRTNGANASIIGFVLGTPTILQIATDVTKPHITVASIAKSGLLSLYVNNIQSKVTSAQSGANTISNSTARIAQYKSAASGLNGSIYMQAMWNRALSDKEVASILANPWQLFTTDIRPAYHYKQSTPVVLASGQALLDFGLGSNEAQVTVSEPTVTSNSLPEAFVNLGDSYGSHSASDHDYFNTLAGLTCSVTPGVGITIFARSFQKLSGLFKVRYIWSNPSTNVGIATLDFGTGSNECSLNITGISGILATAYIDTFILATDTTSDHTASDHKYVPLLFKVTGGNIVPGTGFTLYAKSLQKLQGTFKVRYVWVN